MSSDQKSPAKESGCESENPGLLWDSLDGTIKANEIVADSSLTASKCGRESSEDTECLFDKDNEECNGNTGQDNHHFGDRKHSSKKNVKRLTTRYFIIKSLNHNHIQVSVEKGIWATQVMNEPILEEAFHNSDKVILIFSVNMSGFFQGYARMMSFVGWRRDYIWSKSGCRNNPWGRTFRVKWLKLNDLPFQKTLHLKNPLNDDKPVKISRDCQELSEDVGEALCGLFDGEVDNKEILKRNSPVNFQDEDCQLSASSHLRWAGSTMLHSSLLSEHIARHEEHNSYVTQKSLPSSSFLQGSPFYMESSKVTCLREPHSHGSARNRQGDQAAFLQPNKRDTPREENFTLSLSEEDILNMADP